MFISSLDLNTLKKGKGSHNLPFWHTVQYKEAILVYAILLKAESDQVSYVVSFLILMLKLERLIIWSRMVKNEQEFGGMQVKSTIGIGHKCEAFMYDVFQEKVL